MKQRINILFVLVNLFIFSYTKAQQQRAISVITGKVTDAKTGEPLARASVYFPDLKRGTVTNDSGTYKIQNIARGNYLIEITYAGYASVIETISLSGSVQKDFALNTTLMEN